MLTLVVSFRRVHLRNVCVRVCSTWTEEGDICLLIIDSGNMTLVGNVGLQNLAL